MRPHKWTLPILILLTIGWSRFMTMCVAPLTSKEIVGFEFARTESAANAAINNWIRADMLGQFQLHIYLDYIFIVIYGLCLFTITSKVSKKVFTTHASKAALSTGLATLIACTCDSLENMGMLFTIAMEPHQEIVLATFWFAVVKFSLIACLIVYALGAAVFSLVSTLRRGRSS